MALTQEQVSMLYVAIFNRASEGEGNKYWQNDQPDIASTADAMLATPDAKEYFGDTIEDNQAFIELIYKNTLNKTADDDPEGIAYWVNELNNGKSKGEVVAALINAIEQYKDSDDPKTKEAYDQFMNRVEVSNYVAEHVEKAPENYKEVLGFNGDLVVTADPETVKQAEEKIDELISPAFELTPDNDNLSDTLTDGNDIINADSGTLGSGDVIVDPSTKDNDTLNATLNSSDLAPTIMNVETINLTGEYAKVGLDLTNVIGAKEINASASIIGAKAEFKNVSSLATEKIVAGENILTIDVSAAAGGTTDTVTIDAGDAKNIKLAGGAKDDSFALDLNGGSKDLEIASGSSIESVTINSNGSANNIALSEASAGLLKKLIIEGDKDLTISGDINNIMGSATTNGLLVEDNSSAGTSTFLANASASASAAFLNRAAFDVIDLKQTVSNLTINDKSKLILEVASGSATIDVNNVDGDMDAGEGSLTIDVAANQTALTVGANVGALNMTQDTADVTITTLDTTATASGSTAAIDTTVVVTGTKNVEITTWTNDSDEVFSAGDLEGNLVLGFASASAKGATVISGKGDDEITLGTLASGEEYTIVTNDGNDSVIASIGSAGEATVITGAGDDSIDVGSATAVSKITIDGGDGTDEFKFAADLTIGEDDSIDNIENFVDGASAAGQTLTIENMDVLSNMKEFIGVDPGSGSAIDTLKLIGSNGDDTIDLGSIKLTDATDVVQGGGGNDTVTFVKDDIAGETFIFETSASNNGVDTINNFVVGNVNGDILDFSDLLAGSASSAGSAAATADIIKDGDNAYTSNASALASASGKIALLVDIDGGQDITTADGLKEAIASGGEYSNLEIAASGSAGSLIIITSKSNQTDDSHIFYAEQTTAGDVTITEIGVVTDVDIDNFTGGSAGNFFV